MKIIRRAFETKPKGKESERERDEQSYGKRTICEAWSFMAAQTRPTSGLRKSMWECSYMRFQFTLSGKGNSELEKEEAPYGISGLPRAERGSQAMKSI